MRVFLTREGKEIFYTWHIEDNDKREVAFRTSEIKELIASLKYYLSIARKGEIIRDNY